MRIFNEKNLNMKELFFLMNIKGKKFQLSNKLAMKQDFPGRCSNIAGMHEGALHVYQIFIHCYSNTQFVTEMLCCTFTIN